jgi:uncharacterized membrane protein
MSTYKVVLTGNILPGHELEQVKQQISKTFNLKDDSEQLKLMLGGKPLTVKMGVSHDQAQTYQKAIVAAGLGCNVLVEQPTVAEISDSDHQMQTSASQTDVPETESSAPYNPYQQPKADLATDAESGEFEMVEPQKLSAGSGWSWIKEGFHYFKLKPIIWIGMIVVFIVLSIALSMIPFVSLIQNLIFPVFTGGFMLTSYKLYRGESIALGDLFGGFRKNARTLMGVGLWYSLGTLLLIVAIVAVMFLLGGSKDMAQFAQATQMRGAPPPEFLLFILVFMALYTPLLMAYYFAPALVVLNDMPALEAMKLSFKGCLRNVMPFLVYGLAAMVLMIVAAIPIGLGMLIMVPVLFASSFAAYRQIYTTSASP